MPKDTFWFKHDYNARNDKKLVKLKLKHRMKGVGIYWCLVEILHEESGKLKISDLDFLSFEIKEDKKFLSSVVFDFDLFCNDGEYFWSNSVNSRLSDKNDKSVKAKKAAGIRWSDADALQTHCEGNAIEEKRREEKRYTEGVDGTFENSELDNAWKEWLAYRKGKKKRVTLQAADKQITFLLKHSPEVAVEIINRSIMNDWAGLFPPKENNGKVTLDKKNANTWI